jgi:hypothetical protein
MNAGDVTSGIAPSRCVWLATGSPSRGSGSRLAAEIHDSRTTADSTSGEGGESVRRVAPGPPHRAQIGEKLAQLSVIEHTVLGEILGGLHRSSSSEEFIDRHGRTRPARVFSVVSSHGVTSTVDRTLVVAEGFLGFFGPGHGDRIGAEDLHGGHDGQEHAGGEELAGLLG